MQGMQLGHVGSAHGWLVEVLLLRWFRFVVLDRATSDNSDSGTGTLSPNESSSKTLLERGDEYQQKVLDERKKFEEVEYLTGEEGERHAGTDKQHGCG